MNTPTEWTRLNLVAELQELAADATDTETKQRVARALASMEAAEARPSGVEEEEKRKKKGIEEKEKQTKERVKKEEKRKTEGGDENGN